MSKFGLQGLAARLRIGRRLRTYMRVARRAAPRGWFAFCIGASILLLVLAGALQLRWLGQAN